MKSIHDPRALQEITERINSLRPDTQRLWGKMNVSQMLAHCSNAIEVNLGERPSKHSFIGRIFGSFAKKGAFSDKPFGRGLPTDPGFLIADEKEFSSEKQRLLSQLTKLNAADAALVSRQPHPFFGRLSIDEWYKLIYKHLDHHLKQFGA